MAHAKNPQIVGERLLAKRRQVRNRNKPLSEVADDLNLGNIPPMPSSSSATETVAVYKAELEERAAQGDKYAASALKGEVNDEPIDA